MCRSRRFWLAWLRFVGWALWLGDAGIRIRMGGGYLCLGCWLVRDRFPTESSLWMVRLRQDREILTYFSMFKVFHILNIAPMLVIGRAHNAFVRAKGETWIFF